MNNIVAICALPSGSIQSILWGSAHAPCDIRFLLLLLLLLMIIIIIIIIRGRCLVYDRNPGDASVKGRSDLGFRAALKTRHIVANQMNSGIVQFYIARMPRLGQCFSLRIGTACGEEMRFSCERSPYSTT